MSHLPEKMLGRVNRATEEPEGGKVASLGARAAVGSDRTQAVTCDEWLGRPRCRRGPQASALSVLLCLPGLSFSLPPLSFLYVSAPARGALAPFLSLCVPSLGVQACVPPSL